MTETEHHCNGIDLRAWDRMVEAVLDDPVRARVRFAVETRWHGGARTESSVGACRVTAGDPRRRFSVRTDEPGDMGGDDSAPSPIETLMAALNACMIVGYAALCAQQQIALERLEIRSEGSIDLRGFLGIDPAVRSGFEEVRYEVRIRAAATEAQLREIHETVVHTSPTRWNLAHPVRLRGQLIVE